MKQRVTELSRRLDHHSGDDDPGSDIDADGNRPSNQIEGRQLGGSVGSTGAATGGRPRQFDLDVGEADPGLRTRVLGLVEGLLCAEHDGGGQGAIGRRSILQGAELGCREQFCEEFGADAIVLFGVDTDAAPRQFGCPCADCHTEPIGM